MTDAEQHSPSPDGIPAEDPTPGERVHNAVRQSGSRGWWRRLNSDETRNDVGSGLEDIRRHLVASVREAQSGDSGPVYLKRVGSIFSKRTGATFEQFVNYEVITKNANVSLSSRKMAPFIEEFCNSLLRLSKDEKGEIRVDIADAADEHNHPKGIVYQKAAWVAFIRPIPPHTRRYLKLSPRIGFADIPEGDRPEEEWLEICAEDTLAAPAESRIEPELVQAKISAWLARTGLQPDAIAVQPNEEAASTNGLEALLSIIDSLPSSVAAQWSIPASVLRHLRS